MRYISLNRALSACVKKVKSYMLFLRSKDIFGGYSSGVPPLPVPNREVKPAHADGTTVTRGRAGSRRFFKIRAPYNPLKGKYGTLLF